jgi:hypothetical protein
VRGLPAAPPSPDWRTAPNIEAMLPIESGVRVPVKRRSDRFRVAKLGVKTFPETAWDRSGTQDSITPVSSETAVVRMSSFSAMGPLPKHHQVTNGNLRGTIASDRIRMPVGALKDVSVRCPKG